VVAVVLLALPVSPEPTTRVDSTMKVHNNATVTREMTSAYVIHAAVERRLIALRGCVGVLSASRVRQASRPSGIWRGKLAATAAVALGAIDSQCMGRR
jgi:hypothetical protein